MRLKQALDKTEQELAAKTGIAPAAAGTTSTGPEAAQADLVEEPQALDTVVVRSRNRIERLQDVPLSVSVVTGTELDRTGTSDIAEITQRVGNISLNRGNQRTSSLSIRGIGKQGQTEAQDPSVGVIVDGVNYAYNALTSSYNFHDVEAVEVTRGPQGTLLGKNTSLGVINVVTRKPSFTPSADYSLTFGERDRLVGKLAAGGPVVDGLLAWRGSFVVEKGQGDINNRDNRNITYQNIDRASGRVQFLLTPSPDFSARLAFELVPRAGETTNGRSINTPTPTRYADGSVNTLGTDASTRLGRRWFTQQSTYNYLNNYLDNDSVNNDTVRPLVTGSRGASAELNWNLGDHTLTSITAFRDYHFDATNDDGTPFDIYRNAGGFWNDYRQISQELRLSSNTGGFVDYQAGLYLMKVDNNVEYRRKWGNDAGAWFATTAQYNRLDADGAGRYLMQNSLDRLLMAYNSPTGDQTIENKSAAIFGQANWHLSEPLTLTTGIRFTREDRRNTGSTFIRDNGNGSELNPVEVNGVQLGGFDSTANGSLGTNTAAQLGLADQVANKYFGTAITATPGAAYGSLTAAQRQQVADAKRIRASAIGVVFNKTEAEPFKEIQPAFVISPTYKVNENLNLYTSWQYGEKAGISQLTNGVSNKIDGEKTNSFEVGFKSALLDKTLILNANLYLTKIKDYQQSVRVFDEYNSLLAGETRYATATGNVPKVQSKGVEFDGVYAGIRNTTIRFSGAYTDARYKDFPNAAQPAENGFAGADPYRDLSGKTLPGASKFTFNIGADYRRPVLGDKEFHVSFNTAYNTSYNSDNSLSSYSKVPGKSVTDVAIGLGARNKSYDLSLLVKNVFDDDTVQSQTWNSYVPANPRWFGLMFSGKL
ncbi:MAG: TonB-dependent receptor [Azoarcus sp.]|nr:TonB-dependent receptor [Azoarcus sp.]